MSMARVVIMAVVLEGRPKSAVARDYGVSRRWVQILMARYLAEGEAAFEPRSRRPHTSPRRTSQATEDAIVALRKDLAEAGHDAGAETIAWHLRQQTGSAPSVATIWRILSRRGFVTPQPHKRPRSSWRRFAAELPNELWQADITHWPLAGGSDAEILNIVDDHSRLLAGSTARAVFKASDVVEDLHTAMARHGRPERMLTDNGAVFTGLYRGRGWVALERELTALGIGLSHCRPYHPQTCGKVERFHQTLKKWLARQPAATAITDLQTQLDWFTSYYNTRRPHKSLPHQATPATAYAARPKAAPSDRSADTHNRVRADRVGANGVVTLRHGGRLYHIGIGRTHAGTHILLLVQDLHIRIIGAATGELLRELTLDPAHNYQRTGKPRRPPKNKAR
jgi:transposase InsO family protein